MERLRVVLDTNVIIGAHLTSETNHKLLERFKHGEYDLYTNGNLFKEYDEKLNELFQKGTLKDSAVISENLNAIRKRMIGDLRLPQNVQFPTNDPDDRSLFEIAYMTQIDYIVSSDETHVLKFDGHATLKGAKVLRPDEFLRILNSRGQANEKK